MSCSPLPATLPHHTAPTCSLETGAWDTPVPNHLSQPPRLTGRNLWMKTTVGNSLFCYCTSTIKTPTPAHISYLVCKVHEWHFSASLCHGSLPSAQNRWQRDEAGMSDLEMPRSASVFCLVDGCADSHHPTGWGRLQARSAKVRRGC